MILYILLGTQIALNVAALVWLYHFRKKNLQLMELFAEFAESTAVAMGGIREGVNKSFEQSSESTISNATLAQNQATLYDRTTKIIDICEYVSMSLQGNTSVFVIPSARSRN